MTNWIREEISLLKAGFIFSLMMLAVALNPGPESDNATMRSIGLMEYFTSLVLPFYFMFCIRYIKGNTKTSKKPPYNDIALNTWDYFWRAFVAMWVCVVPMTFILAAWPDEIRNIHWVIVTALMLIEIPFVIWILFCSERIEFAKKVILYFKGMPV